MKKLAVPLLAFLLGLAADLLIRTTVAQQFSPGVIPGCVYNATPPTLSNGQQSALQCNVNGQLRVTTS